MMWSHLWILTLVLNPAAEPAGQLAPGPERIAQLITLLGSARFKERETAYQQLNALGEPALAALKRAVEARDPEVSRRAEALVKQIRQRAEAAHLLQPKRLHLTYKDAPLAEVVSDLESKTGLKLSLEGVEQQRRLTLDTGDTTFWEAFDQLCRQAGLVERSPAAATSGQEVRIWNAGGVRQMVIVERAGTISPGNGTEDRLILTSGKPQPLPTCYAGALRIRAMPAVGKALGQTKDETLALIEVSPQPKLSWQHTLEVRLDQAIDEHGQRLFPAANNSTNNADLLARRMVNNGIVVVDADTGRVVTSSKEYPVRLARGAKPSHVLKEVRGAVTGQIKTPLQTMVTVDDFAHAVGKSFQGEDGSVLTLLSVNKVETDHWHLKIRIEGVPEAAVGMVGLPRRVLRGGRIMMRAGGLRRLDQGSDLHLTLVDAAGMNYQLSESEVSWETGTRGLAQVVDAVYYPLPHQGEAVKLVYSYRRLVNVEVPFTLKDVPLP
jgi:hypothetical protein